MIPLAIPNISANEGKYLQACVDENFVSTVGRFVKEFEDKLAEETSYKYAVVTSQGTTALHLGLTALGVDVNDLVIIPDLTFIATANSVAHCKASPWILDVSAETWTLDPALLKTALEENCSRDREGHVVHKESGRFVKCIMPVYTMGLAPDMDAICEIAQSWGLPVLSDGAAALGTDYKGAALGQTGADMTMMSFNGNKIITSGGGGVLLGNDKALMQKIRHMSSTARKGMDYDHDIVGFNYRMTNIQAAVGLGQIEVLNNFVSAKKRIADFYAEAFKSSDDIKPFQGASWSEGNHWFSGIFLPDWSAERVAMLRKHLRRNNIDARPFWKPMHSQAPYADCPRNLNGVTSAIWEQILPLPCSTQITNKELAQVKAAVLTFK
jgi:dTDP-4-amino-4,6-dideoxygalactose transaminase